MNRFMIAAGAGAVVVLAGCGPELAQVPYGSEEARWQKILRENYSGYEAPRTAPPAIRDNVSPRLIEEEEAQKRKNEQMGSVNPPPPAGNPPAENPPAAEDPALMVDKAAERPAAQEQPVAKPAAKSAEKGKDAKPAAKSAEKGKDAKPAAKPAEKGKDAKPAAKPAEKNEVSEYVVKPHDTLGGLAQKFYGDARRSDVIVRANPALKGNPNLLKPGMKLVIPKI